MSSGTRFSPISPLAAQDKKLWDWLQLLIIPLALALSVAWFNTRQKATELAIAAENRKTDREIADQRQMDAAMEAYLDRMGPLVLGEGTRPIGSPVGQTMARAWTVMTLRRLDGRRKGSLLLYLYEMNLVTAVSGSLPLNNADFEDAYLPRALLNGIHLYEVLLHGAVFEEGQLANSSLRGVGMTEALLNRANLAGSVLDGAHLRQSSMMGADLRGTSLVGAHLEHVQLDLAQFQPFGGRVANLTNADLYQATLTGVQLEGAILAGTLLTGTDLRGATVTEAQLAQACNLGGAIMPDGTHIISDSPEEHSGFARRVLEIRAAASQ